MWYQTTGTIVLGVLLNGRLDVYVGYDLQRAGSRAACTGHRVEEGPRQSFEKKK
jgi:hypothetical protein